MDGSPVRKLTLLTLLVSSVMFAACGQTLKTDKAAAPALNNGGGGGNNGVDDAAGFYVRVDADNAALTKILHKTAEDFDTAAFYDPADLATEQNLECKIPAGTTGASADITCILEIEELDLYFQNVPLEINVPSTMCRYLAEHPYYFYAYEPGKGPLVTSHEILADGSINDVTNTSNGNPICQYIYTSLDGPNCCTGSFQKTITTYAADGSFTSNTTAETWGGEVQNCLAGPATLTQSKSSVGQPLPTVSYIEGTGINKNYVIAAARLQSVASQLVNSNFWAANFLNPGDYAPLTRPKALQTPITTGLDVPDRIPPQDSYDFRCVDAFNDIKARIRLLIREWNTGSISSTQNPDQTGFETDYPDQPINDRLDWFDLDVLGLDFPTSLI